MFQNISANPFANTVNLTQQSISIAQNQMNQALTELVGLLIQALEAELTQVVNTLVDNINTGENTTTQPAEVRAKTVGAPISTQNPTIEQEVTANDINAAILAQDGVVNPSDVVG